MNVSKLQKCDRFDKDSHDNFFFPLLRKGEKPLVLKAPRFRTGCNEYDIILFARLEARRPRRIFAFTPRGLEPSATTNKIDDLHRADETEPTEEAQKAPDGAHEADLGDLLLGQILLDVGIPDVDVEADHVALRVVRELLLEIKHRAPIRVLQKKILS